MRTGVKMSINTVVVRLKWDDPLKCAGTLIVDAADAADEVRVYRLVAEVRNRSRDICGTPRLYAVIAEVFAEAKLTYRIIGAGNYREMEMDMRG
jgi:hypothetical protein